MSRFQTLKFSLLELVHSLEPGTYLQTLKPITFLGSGFRVYQKIFFFYFIFLHPNIRLFFPLLRLNVWYIVQLYKLHQEGLEGAAHWSQMRGDLLIAKF